MRLRLGLRTSAVAAAVVGAVISGVGVVPAHADSGVYYTVPGTQPYWITVAINGLNVAVGQGATNGYAQVVQWYNDNGAEQKWYLDYLYDPEGNPVDYTYSQDFEIRNENSGECLTSDGTAGDYLYQLPCDANYGNQVWNVTSTDGYNRKVILNVGTGLNMDDYGHSFNAGTVIDGWYNNYADNQLFWIDKTT